MDKMTEALGRLAALFYRAAEMLAAFVAVVVLIYVLLGDASGPFVAAVIFNLFRVINIVTPQTLIALGLVAFAYAILRFRRRD